MALLFVGSRRPSLASVHSSTSSSRSYSARRLEKERNDKEQRQALQDLRLAKQREQLQQQQQQVVPTPSPRTPHSTDELLPSVEEGKEVFYNDVSHFRSLLRSNVCHQWLFNVEKYRERASLLPFKTWMPMYPTIILDH